MTLSVIMPVYNGEKYLSDAVDSVLSQTYNDYEFIIIDDASTDKTAEILSNYAASDSRIRILTNEKNSGVAASLNRGLDEAKGDYIARMDADDISLPERFEEQLMYMRSHKDVAVCACGIRMFGAKSQERLFSTDDNQLKVDLLFGCCFAYPSVMMRADIFGCGGMRYNPEYEKLEDYALWVKAAETYKLGSIGKILLLYRVHPGQVTQNYTPEYMCRLENLKKYQLSLIGIQAESTSTQAYIKYCLHCGSMNENDIISLSAFFTELKKTNSQTGKYDTAVLHKNLDSVLYGLLGRFKYNEAVAHAIKCGKSKGIKYGFLRAVHGAAARYKINKQAEENRKKLKRTDFSIISNNCWGGMIYQKYGLKYSSPTIGLFIPGEDFTRFCSDLKGYMAHELEFINWEQSRFYPLLKDSEPYPVARLYDVEIYFMHYMSEDDAREKWNRRRKRINYENLIFKLSQRDDCKKEDIEKFLSLKLKNKICFSYDVLDGAITVPGLRNLIGDETSLVSEVFDECKYLNSL